MIKYLEKYGDACFSDDRPARGLFIWLITPFIVGVALVALLAAILGLFQ